MYGITYVWDLKIKQTSENNEKETDPDIENKIGVTSAERAVGRGKTGRRLRGTNFMYKINKLQGYIIQHREHN